MLCIICCHISSQPQLSAEKMTGNTRGVNNIWYMPRNCKCFCVMIFIKHFGLISAYSWEYVLSTMVTIASSPLCGSQWSTQKGCILKANMRQCTFAKYATYMLNNPFINNYSDVIMSAMASQSTRVSIVCSTVCSGAYHRKITALRHWPLWGESTGERSIPLAQVQ